MKIKISQKTISLTRHALTGAALASALALAACGGSPASTNPNFFSVDIDDGKLNGRYNPAGFNAEEVRAQLAPLCTGGELSGYGETPSESLVAFTATCKGGVSAAGGNVEIQRSGDQIVAQSLTYDANGNMSVNSNAAQ